MDQADAALFVFCLVNVILFAVTAGLVGPVPGEVTRLRARLEAIERAADRRADAPELGPERIDDAFLEIDSLQRRADALALQGGEHTVRLGEVEARAENLSVWLASVDRRLCLLAGAEKAQALARAEFFRSAGAGGRAG